jgi:hypothetical protein
LSRVSDLGITRLTRKNIGEREAGGEVGSGNGTENGGLALGGEAIQSVSAIIDLGPVHSPQAKEFGGESDLGSGTSGQESGYSKSEHFGLVDCTVN